MYDSVENDYFISFTERVSNKIFVGKLFCISNDPHLHFEILRVKDPHSTRTQKIEIFSHFEKVVFMKKNDFGERNLLQPDLDFSLTVDILGFFQLVEVDFGLGLERISGIWIFRHHTHFENLHLSLLKTDQNS